MNGLPSNGSDQEIRANMPIAKFRTPVAVFTYNRPEHTERALASLSQCDHLQDCDFFFYSDGPRSESVRPSVEATRKVLRQWQEAFGATIVERNENLGLAKSIVSGVTDLCSRYGKVIVIEDDLVVAPGFIRFMTESLEKYAFDINVMQISGYTLATPPTVSTDAFLLPVTTTWGWATWQRAWANFAWKPVDYDEAKRDPAWRNLFDLGGTGAFSAMLDSRLAGRNDSWGILWWYAVSRLKGVVVYPRDNLVWNGGFDGSGTHCGDSEFALQAAVASFSELPEKLEWPLDDRYDPTHLRHLEDVLRDKAQSQPPVTQKTGVFRALTNRIRVWLQ